MAQPEDGKLFGQILGIILDTQRKTLENLLPQTGPFPPELVQQRIRAEMDKWGLPMNILDDELLEQGIADLDYIPNSPRRNEGMKANGAWISTDIIIAATSKLPEDQQQLLYTNLQVRPMVDLSSGQIETELFVLPIGPYSSNFSIRYDNKGAIEWRGSFFGGPPALLDPASNLYKADVLTTLLNFHDGVLDQVRAAKKLT